MNSQASNLSHISQSLLIPHQLKIFLNLPGQFLQHLPRQLLTIPHHLLKLHKLHQIPHSPLPFAIFHLFAIVVKFDHLLEWPLSNPDNYDADGETAALD